MLYEYSLLKASADSHKKLLPFSVGAFLYLKNELKSTVCCSLQGTINLVINEQDGSIMKNELIDLLCRKSFKYSKEPTFKLVSGRMSNYYINCKPVTLSPRGMFLAGHLVFDSIRDLCADGVGGLTFGADPVSVATAFASGLQGKPVNAFSIRKTMKDHGIIRWIEGDLAQGSRVVIIDDVATTGGSTIRAIERARSEGMDVIKAVILVDRQEGGLENIREHVKEVSAIVSRDDLLNHWTKLNRDLKS
jgi:orotate phosphoribosyltransferase